MNAVCRSLFAFARLVLSLHLLLPVLAYGIDWNEFRIAPAQVAIPEDLEDFSLVALSDDASVVAGNEVADWNLFPDQGPWEFRNQYPFYWTDGMERIQEIAPNTDEIIEFSNGYRGRVLDISRDGKWIVGEYAFANSGRHQAFLYDVENDLFEYLGDFGWTWLEVNAPDKYIASAATGVTGDGSVVVGWARDEGGRQISFRWTREEGMAKVFDYPIGFWDDQPEDRILAISDDGSRAVAEGSRLRQPGGTERVSTVFAVDYFRATAVFPMPNTFSLTDAAEVSGPDNSVLLTIRSELDPAPDPGWFSPNHESVGIRWFPAEDRYEGYSQSGDSRAYSAVSQTDDGNLMTLVRSRTAPGDGPADYGVLWTSEDGLFDATDFLTNTYEIDFGQGGVAKVLPSRDGSTLVAEVYTDSNHLLKALARFDISQPPAPMARLFPGSWYHDGWRPTTMGSFHIRDFPWVWWRNMGWIFIHEEASDADNLWFWQQDLGWCSCPAGSRLSRLYFYATADAEWIYAIPLQGWLHSNSRAWFRLLDE